MEEFGVVLSTQQLMSQFLYNNVHSSLSNSQSKYLKTCVL